jgi:hypothetical protein
VAAGFGDWHPAVIELKTSGTVVSASRTAVFPEKLAMSMESLRWAEVGGKRVAPVPAAAREALNRPGTNLSNTWLGNCHPERSEESAS